jgi:16S rRNA (guanine527-N7)-methyltransferase
MADVVRANGSKAGSLSAPGTPGSDRIAELLHPYLSAKTTVPDNLYPQLARYLELLLKWNARTNLTAIRDPEEIVRRHFGESLFAAQHLRHCRTVLDFGSGAGFPGLPIQLFHPSLTVTLAESQNKKATFLREAIRTLGLQTEVWASRVEAMPAGRIFDVVTMRAVDDMDRAIQAASQRCSSRLILLGTSTHDLKIPEGLELEATVAMTQSSSQALIVLRRAEIWP